MAAVWVQTNSVFSCFPARTLPSCNGYEKKKKRIEENDRILYYDRITTSVLMSL